MVWLSDAPGIRLYGGNGYIDTFTSSIRSSFEAIANQCQATQCFSFTLSFVKEQRHVKRYRISNIRGSLSSIQSDAKASLLLLVWRLAMWIDVSLLNVDLMKNISNLAVVSARKYYLGRWKAWLRSHFKERNAGTVPNKPWCRLLHNLRRYNAKLCRITDV